MNRSSELIDERDFQRVESEILYSIRGPDGDDLDVVLNRYLTYNPMRVFLGPRPQGKGEFTFSINRNAAYLIPLFADELQTNAVVCRGRDVLSSSW